MPTITTFERHTDSVSFRGSVPSSDLVIIIFIIVTSRPYGRLCNCAPAGRGSWYSACRERSQATSMSPCPCDREWLKPPPQTTHTFAGCHCGYFIFSTAQAEMSDDERKRRDQTEMKKPWGLMHRDTTTCIYPRSARRSVAHDAIIMHRC